MMEKSPSETILEILSKEEKQRSGRMLVADTTERAYLTGRVDAARDIWTAFIRQNQK